MLSAELAEICFGVCMATCNLCHQDMTDDQIEDHRRSAHPEIDADGTRKSDGSHILPDVSTRSVRGPHPAEDA